MPWRSLSARPDRRAAKAHNLARAAKRGLAVPPTWWAPARGDMPPLPDDLPAGAFVLRSAAIDEDGEASSAAGRYRSEVVGEGRSGASAWARVCEAMASAEGLVLLQPFVEGDEAGVVFFDGYFYERAASPGTNADVTAGRERGRVTRGHLERGDAFSDWLRDLGRAFRRERGAWRGLDVEYVRRGDAYVVLQVRPALFPVRRNPWLSLANHEEILGEVPSPWITSALEKASGRVLSFFAAIDPAVRRWREPYAVVRTGRAWMNFSVFFRLMDRWGLPRAFVTRGVGGGAAKGPDARFDLRALVLSAPRLLLLAWESGLTVFRRKDGLARLDAHLARARDLPALFRVQTEALALAIRTNFAINGLLSGLGPLVGSRGGVVTSAMMRDYDRIRGLPRAARDAALDTWIRRYGHRGPLESDPLHPRFAEMTDTLRRDAYAAPDGPTRAAPLPRRRASLSPLSQLLAVREGWRDALMRRWFDLRRALLREGSRLVAAGRLDRPDDVFWLRGEDLEGSDLRACVAAARRAREAHRALEVPRTIRLDDLEALARGEAAARDVPADGASRYEGIALSRDVVEGRVVKAHDVRDLLGRGRALFPDAILVVRTLEPSWAVLFGRVRGVVAELGGELSHASILLREAGKPALVSVAHAFDRLVEGQHVRLDGKRGELLVAPPRTATAGGGVP